MKKLLIAFFVVLFLSSPFAVSNTHAVDIEGNFEWTNASSVTAKGVDNNIFITNRLYRINGGSWQNGDSVTVTQEGETKVQFRVEVLWSFFNLAVYDSAEKTIKIDRSAPEINITNAAGNWIKSSGVSVTATASDKYSGVNTSTWQYSINGGAWQNGSSITISNEGQTKVKFKVKDIVGNEATKETTVHIDNSNPVLSITNPATSWTNSSQVSVLATATDSFSNINTSTWQYSVNDAPWQNGSSITINNEGQTKVKFKVKDIVGNETINETIAHIDRTSPVISITNPSTSWTNSSEVVVLATAVDKYSDIDTKTWQYSINDGVWKDGSNVSITSEGSSKVSFKFRDNAGNEAISDTTVYIDRTSPTLTITNPDEKWANKDSVTVSAISTDEHSGFNLAGIQYNINNNGWQNGNDATITAEGETKVSFRAIDLAGNEKTAKTTVKIDRTAPTVTISNPNSGWTNVDSVPVSAFFTDTYSGINEESKQYRIGTGNWQKGSSVNLTDEGETKITFKALDNAGIEVFKDTIVMIDRTSPSISGVTLREKNDQTSPPLPEEGYINTGNFFAFIDVSDEVHGKVLKYRYLVSYNDREPDFVNADESTSNIIYLQNVKNGSGYLYIKAIDMAGNESLVFKKPLSIDSTTPGSPLIKSYTHPYASNTSDASPDNNPVFFIISGTNGVSGIEKYIYSLYKGNVEFMSNKDLYGDKIEFPELPDNSKDEFYTLKVWAVSKSGKTSNASASYLFRIDSSPPVNLTVKSPTHLSEMLWYPYKTATFTWNEPLDFTGIKSYYYKIDSNPVLENDMEGSISTLEKSVNVNLKTIFNGINHGTLSIGVWAEDFAGNKQFDSRTVRFDIELPDLINLPSLNEKLEIQRDADSGYALVRWGTPADNTGISRILVKLVKSGSNPAQFNWIVKDISEGTQEYYGLLPDTDYTLYLKVVDLAENEKTFTRIFRLNGEATDLPTPFFDNIGNYKVEGTTYIDSLKNQVFLYIPPELELKEYGQAVEKIELDQNLVFSDGTFISGGSSGSFTLKIKGFELSCEGLLISRESGLVLKKLNYKVLTSTGEYKDITYQDASISGVPDILFTDAEKIQHEEFSFLSKSYPGSAQNDGFIFQGIVSSGFLYDSWMIYQGKADLSTAGCFVEKENGAQLFEVGVRNIKVSHEGVVLGGETSEPFSVLIGGNLFKVTKAKIEGNRIIVLEAFTELEKGNSKLWCMNFSISLNGEINEMPDSKFYLDGFSGDGLKIDLKDMDFVKNGISVKDALIELGSDIKLTINGGTINNKELVFDAAKNENSGQVKASFSSSFKGFLSGAELNLDTLRINLDSIKLEANLSIGSQENIAFGNIKIKDTVLTILKADSLSHAEVDLAGTLILPDNMMGCLKNREIPVSQFKMDDNGNIMAFSARSAFVEGEVLSGDISFMNGEISINYDDSHVNPLEFNVEGQLVLPPSAQGVLSGLDIPIRKMTFDEYGSLSNFSAFKELPGYNSFNECINLKDTLVELKNNAQKNELEIKIDGYFSLSSDFPLGLNDREMGIKELLFDSKGNIKNISSDLELPYITDLLGGIKLIGGKVTAKPDSIDGSPEFSIDGILELPKEMPGILSSLTVKIERLAVDENANIKYAKIQHNMYGDYPFIGNSLIRDFELSIERKLLEDSLTIGVNGMVIIPSNEESNTPELQFIITSLQFDINGEIKDFDAAFAAMGDSPFIGDSILRDARLGIRKKGSDPLEMDIQGVLILPQVGENGQILEIAINNFCFDVSGNVKSIDVNSSLLGDTPIVGGVKLRNGSLGIIKRDEQEALEVDISGKIILPESEIECISNMEVDVEKLKFDMNGNLKVLKAGVNLPGERILMGGLKLKDGRFYVDKSGLNQPLVFNISGTMIMPSDAPGALSNSQLVIGTLTFDENGNILNFSTSLDLNGDNEFIGDTKLRNATISVSKSSVNDPVEFLVSGTIILPSTGPETFANAEIAISEFKLDVNGKIKTLKSSIDLPGERKLAEGLNIKDMSVGINVLENSPFEIAIKGNVILGDNFPEGLKGMVLTIKSFTFDEKGQLKNLDMGVDNLNLTVLEKLQISNGSINAIKGSGNDEYLFSVKGHVILPSELPEGLGGMRIAIKDFKISSIRGVTNFLVGMDSRVNFDLYAGIEAGFTNISIGDSGFSLAGDLTFPGDFPQGLANTTVSLNNLEILWDGTISDIDAGISSTIIELGGFSTDITNLRFNANGISIGSCMLTLPPDMGSRKFGFRNAGFDKNGVFHGDAVLPEINQDIAGFTLIIKEPSLSIENEMIAFKSVELKMPPALGGATTGFNGVQIKPSGLIITGGNFQLPNFEASGGLGFRDVKVDFLLSGQEYYIDGGGSIIIPGAGTFSTTVCFVNKSDVYPIGLKRAEFTYKVSGIGVPLGSTGLYLNEIVGGLAFGPPDEIPSKIRDMFDNGTRIKMGVGMVDQTGGNVIKAGVSVWIDITDWDWAFMGNVSVLRGIAKGEVIAALTNKGFYGSVGVEMRFVRGKVEVYVFNHNGSTKVSGSGNVEFGIPKGCIVNIEEDVKVFGVKIGTINIKVPDSDWWLANIGAEFGLFKNGSEGFKGYVDVPVFGRVGAFISSSGSFNFTDINRYELYRPFATTASLRSSMAFAPSMMEKDSDKTDSSDRIIMPESIPEYKITDQYTFVVPGTRKTDSSPSEMRSFGMSAAMDDKTGETKQQEVERIVFAIGYIDGDPKITAISPSGKRYTVDSEGVVAKRENWGMLFAILNPEPGHWDLEVANVISHDSYHVEIFGKAMIPEITLTSPAFTGEHAKGIVNVTGSVKNAPAGSVVEVYLSDKKDNFVGEPAAQTFTGEDGKFEVQIPTDNLMDGEYFVYASLNRKNDEPDVRVYAPGSVIVMNSDKPLLAVKNLIVSDNDKKGIDIRFEDLNGDRTKGFNLYVDNLTKGVQEKILLGYIMDTTIPGFDAGDVLKVRVVPYDSNKKEGESSKEVSVTINAPKDKINTFDVLNKEVEVLALIGDVATGSIVLTNSDPLITGTAYDYVKASVLSSTYGLGVSFAKDVVNISRNKEVLEYHLYTSDDIVPGQYKVKVLLENKGNNEISKVVDFNVILGYPDVKMDVINPGEWNNKDTTILEIGGKNFFNGTKVMIDDIERPIKEITSNLIKIEVGPGEIEAGEHKVEVIGANGSTAEMTVKVIAPDYEIVAHKTHAFVKPGNKGELYFSIRGKNGFDGEVGFSLDDVPTGWIYAIDKGNLKDGETAAVSVHVPEGESEGEHLIKAVSENGDIFTLKISVVSKNVPPVISSLSKFSGFEGDEITIYGDCMGDDVTARIGSMEMDVLYYSESKITVLIPYGASTELITVESAEGISNSKTFYVKSKGFGIYPEKNTVDLSKGEESKVIINVLGYENSVNLSAISDSEYVTVSLDKDEVVPNDIVELCISVSENAPSGQYIVIVKGAGSNGSVQKSLLINVGDMFEVSTSILPDATAYSGYTANIACVNARGKVKFSITEGSLPSGLSLEETGEIHGKPVETGLREFTVTAVDGENRKALKVLTLFVSDNSWFKEGKDGGRTNYNPSKAPATNTKLWVSSGINGAEKIITGGGNVYVMASESVYSLDNRTGSTTYIIEGKFKDMAYIKGMLVLLGENGVLKAVDSKLGQEKWSVDGVKYFDTDGNLLLASIDEKLALFNVSNGEIEKTTAPFEDTDGIRLWQMGKFIYVYGSNVKVLDSEKWSLVFEAKSRIKDAACDEKGMVLLLEDGTLNILDLSFALKNQTFVDTVDGDVVLTPDKIIISGSNNTTSIERGSLAKIYEKSIKKAGIAASNEKLFITGNDGTTCLNGYYGNIIWSDKVGSIDIASSGEMIFVLSHEGRVTCYNGPDNLYHPVTEAILTPSVPQGKNGFHSEKVKVSLHASDPESYVNGTYYSTNGVPYVPYNDELQYDEGKYIIKYYSVDSSGYREPDVVKEIKIDYTAPVIKLVSPVKAVYKTSDSIKLNLLTSYNPQTMETVSASVYETIGPIEIGFSISDNVSGIDTVTATLNGRKVSNGETISLRDMLGTNTLHVEVTDLAGNTSVKTVTFAVDPVVDGRIKVFAYNLNTKQYTNTISPKIQVLNNSDQDVDLSGVKVRYYFTSDGDIPQNFWCDWASVGSFNITAKFVRMEEYRNKADSYLEIGFKTGAGALKSGELAELHLRFAKSDWSNFDQYNDYSYIGSKNYEEYRNAAGYIWNQLEFGSEPYGEIVPKLESMKVQIKNKNTSKKVNQLSPDIRLLNNGNMPINLKDVKLRYYYTKDGDKPQNFWCDWSNIGNSNVYGTFVTMTDKKEGADTYLEIGFKDEAGVLPYGSFIDLQIRFAKSDWSVFDQSNDYSFYPDSSNYGDWDKVIILNKDEVIWGSEP